MCHDLENLFGLEFMLIYFNYTNLALLRSLRAYVRLEQLQFLYQVCLNQFAKQSFPSSYFLV